MVLAKCPLASNVFLSKSDLTQECDKEKNISKKLENDPIKIPEDVEDNAFVIKDIASKGIGMVANKKLYPGDVIVAETPLVVVPDDIFNDSERIERFLDKAITKMSCKDREIFLSLSDCRQAEPSYVGIFYTNGMNFGGDAALFPTLARANHSCHPNAEFISRIESGVQYLYAMTVIEAGEEICINYMPASGEGLDHRETRSAYLRTYYGFQCLCRICTLQDEDLERNDLAREEVKELQAVGLDNLPSEDLEDLLDKLHGLSCKLTYILDVVEALHSRAKDSEDVVNIVKYGVKGHNLATIVHGDEAQETKEWKLRAAQWTTISSLVFY